jgi:hypothetical protein
MMFASDLLYACFLSLSKGMKDTNTREKKKKTLASKITIYKDHMIVRI